MVALLSLVSAQKDSSHSYENRVFRYNFEYRFDNGYKAQGYISLQENFQRIIENTVSVGAPITFSTPAQYVEDVYMEVYDNNGALLQRGYAAKNGTSYDSFLYFDAQVSGNSLVVNRLDIHSQTTDGSSNASQNPYFVIANDLTLTGADFLTPTSSSPFNLLKYDYISATYVGFGTAISSVWESQFDGNSNSRVVFYDFEYRFNNGYTAQGYISLQNDFQRIIENTISVGAPITFSTPAQYVEDVYFEVYNNKRELLQRGYAAKFGISYDSFLYFDAQVSGDSLIVNRLDIHTQTTDGPLNASQNPYFVVANDLTLTGADYLSPTSSSPFNLLTYDYVDATYVGFGSAVSSSWKRRSDKSESDKSIQI